MEDDFEKVYDAILKLNKRISELDQRNLEIETLLSTISPKCDAPKEEAIFEQEGTILDPYNIGGHKSVSMPNGGVIRLKSKSLCVNGRHAVDNPDEISFCSKCSAIVCKNHTYDYKETICTGCLKNELNGLNEASLYALFAIKERIPIRTLKKKLNIPKEDLNIALQQLMESKCVRQDIFFHYRISMYGEETLSIAKLIYDFDFLFAQTK
ncbi:MAG: hypothetical protein M1348_03555 [Candidatus Parvarchaeota archaeon]|nr:hypothetical protein [Candidatus Parvarchaeota archaeon]